MYVFTYTKKVDNISLQQTIVFAGQEEVRGTPGTPYDSGYPKPIMQGGTEYEESV